ncbi:MAG: glycosyltransferase family 2 protein [Mucilaginibacter sp.]
MLSILIPTFNRGEFLQRNLLILNDIIQKAGCVDSVNIIISNNCSTDDTGEMIKTFKENHPLEIILFDQDQNKGPLFNVLFVLSKSTSEYIMYLGDDDYISYEYFMECISIINNDKNTYVIIPNYFPVSVDDEILGPPRDKMEPTIVFKPGFATTLKNSYRGHQLSGLVLKRDGLLDVYSKNGVNNLYMYIYFIGIWSLKGNIYRVSSLPVRVTQPVKKKDWGYGDDGLINDVFDNYKKLPVSYFQRYLLEADFFVKQNWRLLMYKKLGLKQFFKAYRKVSSSTNATFLFSATLPVLVTAGVIKNNFKKLKNSEF